MRISSSLCNKYNFKSNISFDIGGSQREGSCKIYYATDNDEPIFRQNTTVNKLGKTQFKDGDDFIQQLIEKIKKIQDRNKKYVQSHGYPASENIIKNIAIFLPSYTCGTRAYYLPNHRAADNRPLKDINFSNLKTKMKDANIKIAPNLQIKIIQDAMGAGMAICKKLYDSNLLHKGSYYTVCITGGGCGIADIEVFDKNNIIIKSSGSGYLSQGLSMQKVSKVGASARALIENFGRAFGLNEDEIADLKSCNKSEYTMQNPCTFVKDDNTKKLQQFILNTNKYDVAESETSFTISVKPQYINDYNDARRNAIDKYCLALASFAIIRKNQGSNGMIITGPVAKSVNDTALKHYNRGVGEWITKHLKQSFNSYELEKMQETYKFAVICDENYSIENNTECKNLIHKAQFINPQRGNWMKITEEDLKNV